MKRNIEKTILSEKGYYLDMTKAGKFIVSFYERRIKTFVDVEEAKSFFWSKINKK